MIYKEILSKIKVYGRCIRIIKKLFKLRYVIIIVFLIAIGFFAGYKVFKAPKNDAVPWTVTDINNKNKKYITKDTLIQAIYEKQKIITTEVDLKETLEIDNSWGNWDVFKKIKKIIFFGKGIYTIDLSKVKDEDITLNTKGKIITIEIPEPNVEMVNIDNEKTQYSMEKGSFRFGDIKLTNEEVDVMKKDIEDKMKEKMNESKYISDAEENSKNSLKKIIQNTVNDGKNSIVVNVKIKK